MRQTISAPQRARADLKPPLRPFRPQQSAASPRNLRLVTAGAFVVAGILLLTYFQIRAKNTPVMPPLQISLNPSTGAPFPHSIAAPGLIESASGLRNLSFDAPGAIKTVCVEEGDSVKAGQLLAELENGDALAGVDSARANLAAAEAKSKITACNVDAELIRAQKEVDRLSADLALLQAGPRAEEIERAKAEARAAEAEAKRAAEDAEKYSNPEAIKSGAWSIQLRDNSARTAEIAAARLDAARAHAQELAAGSRAEEIARARAALAGAEAELARQKATQALEIDAVRAQAAQARAQLSNAEALLKKTRLYAPIDGKVVWKFLHSGEAIDAIQRQPVLAVADLAHLRVRASVDEADYPRVFNGQRVKISADAFDGKWFNGRVELIGNSAGEKPFSTGEAKERRDVRVIDVLIALDSPTPLKLGLRVTAYFETK